MRTLVCTSGEAVPVGGTRRISAMVDVINLLNADTPLDLISEVVTSTNFARATTRFDPRRAMAGLRLEF